MRLRVDGRLLLPQAVLVARVQQIGVLVFRKLFPKNDVVHPVVQFPIVRPIVAWAAKGTVPAFDIFLRFFVSEAWNPLVVSRLFSQPFRHSPGT